MHIIGPGITLCTGDIPKVLKPTQTFQEDSSKAGIPENDTPGAPAYTLDEFMRMLVSSKHLILASPVFKAMLSKKFQEGNTLCSTGHLEISLLDDNPDAFSILLSIIHGKIRNVPREVSLRTLSQISILVDKYELHEVAETFSDGWLNTLRPFVPRRLTENMSAWLNISWVFCQKEHFTVLTKIVEEQMEESWFEYLEEDLVIPGDIIGMAC
jgi:hypothetical protein